MNYPDHWEADVVLSDGGTAHLRPIRPADAELLRAFYARLSPESIYYRFFSPRPSLTDREIEHFTTVDHQNRAALIATIGGEMIAVVRYERTNETEAEAAFLVEDAHQGRGLGGVLLEHIAAAARERGVRRFIADVLPDNRRMIKVFRDAGYKAEQRFEEGAIRLTLDLEPTETSRTVMAAREQRAESRSIARLLFPRSVAVIGAGRGERNVGRTILRHLLGGDFAGPVYPVHPTAAAVAGVRAYPTVLDIPDDVDLAVVAVRAETAHEVVAQCASKGVHGLVVVSAGFAETGEPGRARQEDLVRLAREHGMRVVGPNCLGVANTDPAVRLNATLAPTMPGRGPVGFFSQSGALGIAILQRTAERGIGLSTFVSAGNRADVSGNDLMQYWETDPATSALLLYLESIGNPRKFTGLARRLSRTKPIVAVKTGRTTQGVPLGHAVRALTLPDHAVSALFAQAGVIRVEDLSELFDVAQLLAYQPLPSGGRVAIIDNSDSLGLLAEDAATALGLHPTRPVDLGPGAGAAEFENALAAALADETVDAVVVLYTPPVFGGDTKTPAGGDNASGGDNAVARAIVRTASGSRKPVVATYLGMVGLPGFLRASWSEPQTRGGGWTEERSAGRGNTSDEGSPRLERGEAERETLPDGEAGPGSVPSYPAPEDAVRALAYVARYAVWRRRPQGRVPAPEGVDRDRARALVARLPADGVATTATPEQAAELLACYGIPVMEGPADDGDDGVAMRIATVEDPSFGGVVSFGLTDVAAELLDDRAYRLAPLTDVEASEMVRAVRTAPLLFGHHGAKPVDVAALEQLLLRVARLGDDLPEVARLELDPVVATASDVFVRRVRLSVARPMGPRYGSGPRRL